MRKKNGTRMKRIKINDDPHSFAIRKITGNQHALRHIIFIEIFDKQLNF